MKRFTSILIAAFALFALPLSADAGGKVIPFSKLPTEAQNFIKTHFSSVKVLQATSDWSEYEVILEGNAKLEFDRSGNWKEINCRGGSVPESAVPARIQAYVKDHFSPDKVRTIERHVRGYEVKVTSGIELKFDKNCNFVRLDD